MPSLAEKDVDTELHCTHCSDVCDDDSIRADDTVFCCLGCKTVYQILHENGLDAYYRLEDQPGVSLKHNKGKDYYAFIDKEDIQRKILNYLGDDLAKLRLFIPSIHCSSCIWLLENLYKLKNGINLSIVNFPRKELSIDYDPRAITLREVVEMLASLGYEPEITLETTENKNQVSKHQRNLLIKIGVAGFAFGNIMLFSFPEYVGLDRLVEPQFSRFFSFVSMVFSLPVIFFSASDYFKSAWSGLKQRLISIDVPIVIGVVALFTRSVYEVAMAYGTGYFDSLAGLIFFLLLGKWFQGKTYESLLFDRNYKSYFPVAVTKLLHNGKDKDNDRESIPINELVPGDRILIRNAELIPADAVLISEEAWVDNSFVTGESRAVRKCSGDYIYAGGKQAGPVIELEVAREVSQSYLTQLWNKDAFKKSHTSNQKDLINKISKYFTAVVLLIAFGAGTFWLISDPSKALNAFTAVLIVACPCALALATPFAVGSTLRVFGRNGFYLKNGDVVELLANVDEIVFDKTGTITMQSQDRNGITFTGELNEKDKQRIADLTTNSSHPLSRIIAGSLTSNFSTGRNRSISDYTEVKGKGISAKVDGAGVMLGSAEFTGYNYVNGADHRTSRVFVTIDNEKKGFFSITNTYRENFERVIIKLRGAYKMSVLSGDNSAERSFLENVFPENTELYFEQTAYDKLGFVKKRQDTGSNVLMIGDGLNDSGALAQADVGIAVADNVNNFTPASDAILSGSNFSLFPAILSFSKTTVKVIIYSFVLSFIYNIAGLGFAISGNLTPVFAAILMPLSSISVVVFTTGAINLMASKVGFR